MFIRCIDIINIMNDYADPKLAETWDNVGLIVGDENRIIKNILVALDINDEVIDEAIENKCDMIITHHPFIFKPIKSIKQSDILGSRVIRLIQNNIAVFSAHTNLDIARNGTNDTLAKLLNLKNVEPLFNSDGAGELGLGRVGMLPETANFSDFVKKVKDVLGLEKVVVCGDLDTEIGKVGICTGSGGELDFILKAKSEKCDVYITGDLKYHNSQIAQDLGLCIIDGTHYATEVIIVPVICNYIKNCAKRLNFEICCIESKVNGQTLNII